MMLVSVGHDTALQYQRSALINNRVHSHSGRQLSLCFSHCLSMYLDRSCHGNKRYPICFFPFRLIKRLPLYCTQVRSLIGDVLSAAANHVVVMLAGPARVTGVVLSAWTSQPIQINDSSSTRVGLHVGTTVWFNSSKVCNPCPCFAFGTCLMRPHGHRPTTSCGRLLY
jgi:hypothetical protein